MSRAAEHRAALHKVQDGIVRIEKKVVRADSVFHQRLDSIENDMPQAMRSSDRHFHEISAEVEVTNTSVTSLRSTGEHILRCLRTFPREMRELLQNIIRANWQMHQVLLNIQQKIDRSPTALLESNIQFEDALGDYLLVALQKPIAVTEASMQRLRIWIMRFDADCKSMLSFY